jgi:hypothetical protein
MAKGSDLPAPKQVTYHPVTGVPEEFHEYLHKDSDEYKLLKQSMASGGGTASTSEATEKMAATTLVRKR